MYSKTSLTTDDAHAIMEAAKAEAVANGWTATIAVVDEAGNLLLLERNHRAGAGTVDAATRKARTASGVKCSTLVLEQRLAGEPVLLALDLLPMQGGVPIFCGDECVGGVGVSGLAGAQDEQVATAGAAVVAATVPG